MSARAKPPFRADHVGSLLRSPEVHRAREDFQKGNIPPAKLREIEDKAIRDAIRMQEDVGLKAVTDGEIRRATWHMDFLYQIGGLKKVPSNIAVKFHSAKEEMVFTPAGIETAGKLKLTHTIFEDDFKFVRDNTKVTPKLSIPSPNMIHYRSGQAAIDPKVYPDMKQFWSDLSGVYAEEIARLHKIGCRYLQIDDTSLASINDPEQRKILTQLGGDGEHEHETYIRALNDALKNKPADMTVATHMCRGNYKSAWTSSGSYDWIAEALFTQLKVDAFFLEYDDARSGGFEPLRFMPKDKIVVLGLVTTKQAQLESKDHLKRRIDEAAKYVPIENLCLSPQYGFSSTVEGNALTYDQQMAKLRLVVETAREVWGGV